MLTRRSAVAGAVAMAGVGAARAQTPPTLRIGVLNDQTGPYRENGGPGSVACARQAVQEMAGKLGLTVDVIGANHQNKADIGATIARKWFDEDGVDAILDIQNSAIALAIADIAREKDKIVMPCAGVSDLTGKRCTPNTVHWCYDTSMLSRVLGDALVKNGGDSWFFITADYAFGHSLESETAARVEAAGGKVVGSIRMPFPTADFSSALVRAQTSGAKIIALANAGSDTHQRHQAGRRVRGDAQRRQGCCIADPDFRCSRHRPAGGPGAGPHRDLLLGSQRGNAGLLRTSPQGVVGQGADGTASRLLCRDAALHEGGGCDRRDGRQALRPGSGRTHEGDGRGG
jgi:ABC-type branched-subunit amino acid transport system substrate-binding protein